MTKKHRDPNNPLELTLEGVLAGVARYKRNIRDTKRFPMLSMECQCLLADELERMREWPMLTCSRQGGPT